MPSLDYILCLLSATIILKNSSLIATHHSAERSIFGPGFPPTTIDIASEDANDKSPRMCKVCRPEPDASVEAYILWVTAFLTLKCRVRRQSSGSIAKSSSSQFARSSIESKDRRYQTKCCFSPGLYQSLSFLPTQLKPAFCLETVLFPSEQFCRIYSGQTLPRSGGATFRQRIACGNLLCKF
ncbi:unnamed protein product [Protopolystoma xenopodis]|uniref:Uncharacterized protein n=1 Tax=Protopolystoma xenopodis TaxID=117903 RepID=A0A448XIC2_9PLAT|nr:unnamed protein product [Protopolystoma xenopodis]